jgi:hypothetical protein
MACLRKILKILALQVITPWKKLLTFIIKVVSNFFRMRRFLTLRNALVQYHNCHNLRKKRTKRHKFKTLCLRSSKFNFWKCSTRKKITHRTQNMLASDYY